jgi:hypothetical protein
MTITPDQAIAINETIDIIHSTFPYFMALGVYCIAVSFLPAKTAYESYFDKCISYIIAGFGAVLVLYLISQAVLGGCIVHIPENWIARTYLGRSEWWPFGLFGRRNWPFALWTLRLLYAILSILSVWRFRIYMKNRLPKDSSPAI